MVKNMPANAGTARNVDSIPWSGRSSGEGNGSQLQHSCLENSMERGAWQATGPGVLKSQTLLCTHTSRQHKHGSSHLCLYTLSCLKQLDQEVCAFQEVWKRLCYFMEGKIFHR